MGYGRYKRKYQKRVTKYSARRSMYKRYGKRFIPGKSRTGGFYGRYQPGGTEVKFHDIDIDDAVIESTGSILLDSCNKIPQGVTEIQRIGRKCTITKIAWRYQLTLPVAAAATGIPGDVIRIVLYLDKQCNGATANVLDIVNTDDWQSFNNLGNSGRFKILMDKTIDLNYIGGVGDGAANDFSQVTRSGTFYKNCNIPIEFDATTGAITEIRSNNIGILLLGREGIAGFSSKMRLRFKDK